MKKVLFILLCSLIILSGCKPKTDSGSIPQYGNLTLAISPEEMSAQTIEPDLDMNITTYDVYGAGPGGASFQKLGLTNTTIALESLQVGNWTVTVEAKNAGGNVIGDGSIQAVIIADQIISREVTVRPLMGNGTLCVDISWTPGSLINPLIDATLTSGETSFPITFTLGGDGNSAYYEDTQLTAGYHTLILQLKDGETLVWGAMEAVRILAGQVSEGSFHVEPEGDVEVIIIPDLQNPVTITFSGERTELIQGEYMTITAETSVPVDTYQWYLNGNLLAGEIGESIIIGQGLPEGRCRLDLLVAKGNVYSSSHITFTVLPSAYEAFEDFDDGVADNFIDDGSGMWSVVDGQYMMTGVLSDHFSYSYFNADFSDFTYSVDVKQTSGSTGCAYGIYFRSQEGDLEYGYQLSISSIGSWYLIKRLDNLVYWLNTYGDWTTSSYLNTGLNAVNNIKVVCSGPNITIYFNDNLVESVSDTTFSTGKMGIQGFDNEGYTSANNYKFDNFIVSTSVDGAVLGVSSVSASAASNNGVNQFFDCEYCEY